MEEIIERYSPPSLSAEDSEPSSSYTVDDGSTYVETMPSSDSTEVEENTPRRIRKKRISSDRRFDQLIYERGILEQESVFKDSVIAEKNRLLQEMQIQLQQKDKQSNDYFETALQERELGLAKEIKRAKEEGDIDEEIRLIEELADIKAKKNTNSLFQFQRQEQEAEKQQRINEEHYVPIETSIQTYPTEPVYTEEYKDWLEDNSWYSNNSRLRQEADIIAQDLSDRLAFNNQADLIGTSEFFQSVTNLMQSNYGIGSKESNRSSYEQPMPLSNNINNVAPVSRKGINMADQYLQNRNSYDNSGPLRSLTKEEFAIARHLPIRQKGEGEADLVKRFAKAKNYPKSSLDGGSPHRLTII